MKALLIVNPAAGRGRAKRSYLTLENILKKKMDLDSVFTGGTGEATDIARKAVHEGYELLIVVGGDGTLHEVVNGAIGSPAVIAVIPTGTGNDFARSLGIPRNSIQAAQLVNEGKIRVIDVGLAGNEYFINVAGLGFDAQVAKEVNKGTGCLSGTPAYLYAVIKVLLQFRAQPVTLILDGKELDYRVLVVAVANARYYGGGMLIAPEASMDDGLLDVCIVEELSRLAFLKAFPSLFSGTHIKHPKVKTYRAKVVEIIGPGSRQLPVHTDGELLGTGPVTFKIIPRALRVISGY
ncbi:MAG: diacylglycerol/lipid kinase family protein [Bacillota bacterium]